MIDKKELTVILTNHAVGQSKTSYSETDVTDAMLKHYNTEMDKFMKSHPKFDVYSDDYNGTEDDLFINILINVAKEGGFNLIEGIDDNNDEEGDLVTIEEDFKEDLTKKWLEGDKAALTQFVTDKMDKMVDPHINKLAQGFIDKKDDEGMFKFVEMILTKLGKIGENNNDEEELEETKKEVDGKWKVYSKDGKELGSHDTEGEADDQLAAIEISKNEAKTITNEDLANIYETIFIESPESMVAFEEFLDGYLDPTRSTNETMVLKKDVNILEPMKKFFAENEGIGSKLKGAFNKAKGVINKAKGKTERSLGKIFNSEEEEKTEGEDINEGGKTITLGKLVTIAKEAGDIVLDAKSELEELGISYGNKIPVDKIKDILTNYDITGIMESLDEAKDDNHVGNKPHEQDGSQIDDNTDTPAPESGSKLGTQDDPDLGDGQPIKVDGNTVTIKEGDEIETDMIKGSVTKIGKDGIGMEYDECCYKDADCDDDGYGIMSPKTLEEAKSLKINGKVIKEGITKLTTQDIVQIADDMFGEKGLDVYSITKGEVINNIEMGGLTLIDSDFEAVFKELKKMGATVNESKEDDTNDQEGSTADKDKDNTDTPKADGTSAEKGAIDLEKGDIVKIGDIEGTMTKTTDSGIEVETANGKTENIAMKGLNVNEGCEVNGKKIVIKEGKIYEAEDINEDKFSIILVDKDNGDGTINGSWIQNHIGDLKGATQKAIDTEAANSDRQDYAVVDQNQYSFGTGGPTHGIKDKMKRLDTKRIEMNEATKPFGRAELNKAKKAIKSFMGDWDEGQTIWGVFNVLKSELINMNFGREADQLARKALKNAKYSGSDRKGDLESLKKMRTQLIDISGFDAERFTELLVLALREKGLDSMADKTLGIVSGSNESLNEEDAALMETLKQDLMKAFPKMKDDEFDNHESDLYIKHSPEVMAWIEKNYEFGKSKSIVSTFTSEIDRKLWIEVAFAFAKGIDEADTVDSIRKEIADLTKLRDKAEKDGDNGEVQNIDQDIKNTKAKLDKLNEGNDNPYMIGNYELKDGDSYKTKDGTDTTFMGFDDAVEAEGKNYLFDDGSGTQAYTKEEAISMLETEMEDETKGVSTIDKGGEDKKIDKLPMFENFKGGTTNKGKTKKKVNEMIGLPTFKMFLESRKK